MIRFLARLLGLVLLACAFAALITDATRSIAVDRMMFFSFGETMRWLASAWVAGVEQAGEARGLGAMLAGLLELPTWLVAGIAGGLFLALGRNPGRRVGSR